MKGEKKMFAIMYEVEAEKVFKIFNDLRDAQIAANNIACNGTSVTVFDYDLDSESFIEFYTI